MHNLNLLISKKIINKLFILSIIIIFFTIESLFGEEVLLKNGDIVKGRIIGQTSSDMEIDTGSGSKTIPKSQVIKVQYRPFTPEQKQEYAEKQKKDRAAYIERKKAAIEKKRLERLKQEQESVDNQEDETEIVPTEKELEAQDTAKRAQALRELVGDGKMEKPEDEPIEYWDFAWRSIVFPGWGHFTIDRPIVGGLYMATSIALLSGVYETRRIASNAQKENIRQVEFNYLLSTQREIAPLEIRTFFVYNANAQAAIDFQGKVDNYHNSLYTFGTFYGIQFLHIVYNAIAWENGLLIVKKDFQSIDKEQEFYPIFSNHSTVTADGRRETITTIGVKYVF
jgi:hypothetical protein